MKSYFKFLVLLFCLDYIEGSFRCDYKYSSIARAWFRFAVVPANWFDARLRCSLEGAVLASPATPEILAEMRSIINRSNPEYEIFTGIHATVSQGDYYTIEEYHLDKRTNKCYKFHAVPRNFSRAYLACSAEGGHLAIINSETEARVLTGVFDKFPESKLLGTFRKDVAFIGFHDWGENWKWRTIHGQTLTEAGYNKFGVGEPNNVAPGQSCGGIFRSSLLVDFWCDRPAAFICEKSPGFPVVCRALP